MFVLLALALLFAPLATHASRCALSSNNDTITCSYQHTQLPGTARAVYFQVPEGAPPAGGWPTAIFFQGSFAPPSLDWSLSRDDPFGAFRQIQVFWNLLDAGFAVLAPSAPHGLFWETNLPPYDVFPNDWFNSSDAAVMNELFASILSNASAPANVFGESLNVKKLFAFGISSGGYMTSRVAVDLGAHFRAVVIASGAYMTCGGALCHTPSSVPATHPPTLFLNGEIDPAVPIYTAEDYLAVLQKQGVPSAMIKCPLCDHEWTPAAPTKVPAWFQTYL